MALRPRRSRKLLELLTRRREIISNAAATSSSSRRRRRETPREVDDEALHAAEGFKLCLIHLPTDAYPDHDTGVLSGCSGAFAPVYAYVSVSAATAARSRC